MRVLGLTMPDGKKRFCDARCHNSTRRRCDCICGGLLHGKGALYAEFGAVRTQSYIHRVQGTRAVVWLNPQLVTHWNP